MNIYFEGQKNLMKRKKGKKSHHKVSTIILNGEMNAYYHMDTASITQAASSAVGLSGSCLLIPSIHHLFLSPMFVY